MKREKFLWPLTGGHHRGLVAAKNVKNRIAQMGSQTREEEMKELRLEVRTFWDSELKDHFGAEEELLRVFAGHVGEKDGDIHRVLSEHKAMKGLIRQGFKEDLLRFADLLAAHIHFEEEVLFGRLEKALTPSEIQREGEILLKKATPACPLIPGPKGK
jgi:hemerythrin-like domain-containing protein